MTRPGRAFGTGIMQEASGKHGAPIPPFTGRHLFVFVCMYRVVDPARERQVFDLENLVTVEGPGCFWCERQWTPTLGAHCSGGNGS